MSLLAFAAVLVWRYLASTGLAHLCLAQMYLQLEMLWLEALLLMHRLTSTGAATWGLLSLAGITLIVVLALATWEREVFPMWESGL